KVVEEISNYLGKNILFRIPLSAGLAKVIIKTFNIKMAEWDRFCMEYRHFTYQNPVTPSSFGLEDNYPTLAEVCRSAGVAPKQERS
ncbi:MAG: NAD(P)-dependent oxidoreductase, partial [Cyanobacteria bacterium P01_D01_bin.36]